MIQFGLSYLAGLLTTLSPCVLPMLPMIMGGALQKNKLAPLFMAIGLVIGFTTVGFILSRFGSLLGLDGNSLRVASAVFLIFFSVFLFSEKLQDFLSQKLSGFADFGSQSGKNLNEGSPLGAILIGLSLGLIWSPCSGPTLGIAVGLASQEGAAVQAALMMFTFAIGAATPMMLLAYGFRELYFRNKDRILLGAKKTKIIFGILMLVTALFILTGFDKKIEAAVLDVLPESWINLTVKY